LQDTLGNLFAGVQIILSRQVRPSDFVRLASGEEGLVTDVKARNTTIQTAPDGNLLTVPNSVLASSIVKNYTLPTTQLWVTVNVGVAYASDLDQVQRVTLEVAREVLASVDGAVASEPPILFFREFGASSIDLVVRMLVREYTTQGAVRHEFIKRLHRRYAQEGIEIPFPTHTIIDKRSPGD
jgi:small-conductance mechanosensitive channel